MSVTRPVAIRVSTTAARGRGHVSRCLAVRRCLAGPVVWFVDGGVVPAAIQASGDRVVAEADVGACARLADSLKRGEVAAALVDSYDLTDGEVTAVRRFGPVLALCDAAPYLSADVVVDPQPTARGETGGPGFLPIDPALLGRRGCGGRSSASPCRILVAFGAVDSRDRTGLVLRALADLTPTPLAVTVTLGAAAPHLGAVAAMVAAMPGARLVVDADMPPLYAEADLAVGAPGVSQAERMFCGVPTLLVAQNDAQVPLARAWVRLGGAAQAAPDVSAVALALRRVYGSPELRESIRNRGLELIDGHGADRVAALLLALAAGGVTSGC